MTTRKTVLVPADQPLYGLTEAGFDAYNGAKGWAMKDNMLVPTYPYKDVYIHFGMPKEGTHTILTKEALMAEVQKFSPLAVDMAHYIYSAYMQTDMSSEFVTISIDDFLAARGIVENGHFAKDREAAIDALYSLSRIHLRYQHTYARKVYKNGRKKEFTININEPMFICVGEYTLIELDADTREELSRTQEWRVYVGKWIQTLQQNQLLYRGEWDTAVLQIDYYHQPMAKGVAYYVQRELQNSSKGGYDARRKAVVITRMVDRFFGFPGMDVDTRHPIRTLQAFEAALDGLIEQGIIQNWRYKDGVNQSQLPARKWLRRWMQWEVEIIGPQEKKQRKNSNENEEETSVIDSQQKRPRGRPRRNAWQ